MNYMKYRREARMLIAAKAIQRRINRRGYVQHADIVLLRRVRDLIKRNIALAASAYYEG